MTIWSAYSCFVLNANNLESTLFKLMAWCRKVSISYMYQDWLRSTSSYGITRPPQVHLSCEREICFQIYVTRHWLFKFSSKIFDIQSCWQNTFFTQTAVKIHNVKAAPRLEEITGAMRSSEVMWTPKTFRVRHQKNEATDLVTSLGTVHKRVVKNCTMVSTEQLQSKDSELVFDWLILI